MCNTCVAVNTGAVSEDFVSELLKVMNGGALALMISIGHRTGLFDAMAELPAATSSEIATAANLNERYVREWLGAMVVGRIVEYTPTHKQYKLPEAHAAYLTRKAGSDNIATLTQYIAELGSVESRIVECFQNGGGVNYDEFPRFHEVMADDSGQSVLPALENHILTLVPGLVDRLTSGLTVCDVGCGRGKALIQLARNYPQSSFVGYDLSPAAIAWAKAKCAEEKLANVTFAIQDAAQMTDNARFDLIFTFDAIHDQADPQRVLSKIRQALKSDGVYIMQDIDTRSDLENNLDHPIGPLIYTISCMHCMTVSLAQNGAGLGATWGVELAKIMLKDAGFTSTSIQRLQHDIQNAYFINRP